MKNTPGFLKRYFRGIAAGLLLLQPSFGLAAPLSLSLEESVQMALQQNPAVRIAESDREKSAWGVSEAKAGKYPSLSLGSGYTVNNQSASWSSEDVSSNVRLNWQLYSGGRVENQLEQARLGLASADLNIDKTRQQLALDTRNAYYGVLQAENMVSVGQETVGNLEEHQRVAEAKYAAGVVAKSDVLRVDVELANARQNAIRYENQHALAMSGLNNLLNIPASTELALADALGYNADGRTLEECLTLAAAQRPDIAQAKNAILSADTGVKIAEGGKKPSVSMSASSGWENSLLPDGDNWSVGVSASWNIFDAGATKAKIAQAETSRDRAAFQAEQTMNNAEQEVRQSYLSMKEAEKRLETVQVAVAKAQEDVYIAREKYAAGIGTNLDVIDAQLALTQARTNHIQALYDYNSNHAALNKAIGAQP